MQKLLSILITLSFVLTTIGQQFHFKGYSLEEGLSRTGVYNIIQDETGFIWIATDGGGLCRFDGHTFKNYNRQDGLASEKVRRVFEDCNGVLWLGTDNGLSFFDGKKFQTLTTEEGLIDNFVRSIIEDHEENIWVGTNRGISIIDPKAKSVKDKLKFNLNLPHKKIRALIAEDNTVWIGTDAGLCKYEDGEITTFTTDNGLIDNTILCLFIDNANVLWIGTENGLTRYDGENFNSWSENDGLINNRVRSINQDIRNNIWLGTRSGVSIFNGETFLNLTKTNGLTNERIRCVYKDAFNNMWLGTYFGGVMRFNYKDFISFTTKEGLISNQITSITEDENGDMIVGSYDGATKIALKDGVIQKINTVTTEDGILNNHINSVLKDDNKYCWYGTDQGISIVKDGYTKHITIANGLKNHSVTKIKKVGNLFYVGTKDGLATIEPSDNYKSFKISHLTTENGMAGKEVSSITENINGDMWIGFADGGISVISKEVIINPKLPRLLTEINSICFDNFNRVWIGTNGRGMYYGAYPDLNEGIELDQLTVEQKLTSNHVFSILHQNNKLWVGHEKGLDVVSLQADSTWDITNYGIESGFFGLQNNRNASYIDNNNNLWFGTVNGLFCLKDEFARVFSEGSMTQNFITNVDVNGEKINWNNSIYSTGTLGKFNVPEHLELPYDMNSLQIDFIGINYVAPEKIKYTWRLVGFNTNWSNLNASSNYSFTNLSPGDYVFEMKSTNENGVLIDYVTEFPFTISKPFWQTWWFRIVGTLLAGLIVFTYVRLRTRKFEKRQKELEEIVLKRTEKIGLQNKELETKQKEIEIQNGELSFKNKEITDSILYSRRIQNSILPSKEKMQMLLEEHFVIFKPKDIVSGDFYWAERHIDNPNKVYFAVGDCTGHGVPGAMVSLISTRALNKTILEHHLTHPGEILDKTNEIVIDAFTDKETGSIIKDGMDIAVVSIEMKQENDFEVEFAGAQNPIWIIVPSSADDILIDNETLQADQSNETHKLFVINATKQPIGHFDKIIPFKNSKLNLAKGARIFLFSDGYADQFGGNSIEACINGGKKYKYKPLKKFLLKNQHEKMSGQSIALHNEFNRWKQNLEQLDDVCVIGIEL